jgi:hypothetical protein
MIVRLILGSAGPVQDVSNGTPNLRLLIVDPRSHALNPIEDRNFQFMHHRDMLKEVRPSFSVMSRMIERQLEIRFRNSNPLCLIASLLFFAT